MIPHLPIETLYISRRVGNYSGHFTRSLPANVHSQPSDPLTLPSPGCMKKVQTDRRTYELVVRKFLLVSGGRKLSDQKWRKTSFPLS